MDTLVHQHSEFGRYSLWRTKPMQTVKQRSDVVVLTVLEDESSRCIHDRLETIYLERRDTGQCDISEVKLCQHQRSNERLEDRVRQRATNAAQLPQNTEAVWDSSCDLATHADVRVKIDAQISNDCRWCHMIAAHWEWWSRQLTLSPSWCVPCRSCQVGKVLWSFCASACWWQSSISVNQLQMRISACTDDVVKSTAA